MTLEITYDTVVPSPECGYKVLYRQKGGPGYTTVSTSGDTVTVNGIDAPCCIEGNVFADCCDDNQSIGSPFGINSYVQVFVDIQVSNDPSLHYEAIVTSAFGNPYSTMLSGTFHTDSSGGQTLAYTVNYPAGSKEAIITIDDLKPVSLNETITDITITNIAPSYPAGSQLQHNNGVLTPDYFAFIATSGDTWNGSPIVLPSFTIDGFVVTEQEEDLTITEGNLLTSWAYGSIYENGDNPYDNVTFTVRDSNNALIGTAAIATNVKGLRNLTIPLTRALIDLNTTNVFTMRTLWDNEAVSATRTFTLPAPI